MIWVLRVESGSLHMLSIFSTSENLSTVLLLLLFYFLSF